MVEFTLDTDIGSDVDDLMALAMVLGSAEMNLRAVATVYGDTLLRARMVRRAYAVAGRPAPPVAAGAREARSGRPVSWAGHEGALVPDLASEPVDETLDATAVLRASTVVAAVGPLTNVADALDGPHSVEQLVIMGGDITSGKPEHAIDLFHFPGFGRRARPPSAALSLALPRQSRLRLCSPAMRVGSGRD